VKWGEPTSCANASEWHAWLIANHDSASEVFLLVLKDKSSGAGIRYGEAVEEALCFGWIDGIARRFDDDFSLNRFTPRRPKSNWSASNRERVKRLLAAGRVHDAGLSALPDDLKNDP